MTERDQDQRRVVEDELAAVTVLHEDQERVRTRILERIGGLARRLQGADRPTGSPEQQRQARDAG